MASASVSAMKISRTSRQSERLGVRPLLAAPISTDSQWLPTYAGIQVQAHRPVAALAGELQRVGALAHTGHADGRMRLLQRLDVRLERVEHRPGLGDVPVLALVVELGLVAPQAQDDLQRLAGHLAVLPRHAVDVEHRPVARQPAGRHAEVEPALGQMIEHGHPVRELGGMVVGHEEPAGADAHRLGLQERLGHEQVGRGVRLPRRGVVLADPGLAEAQLVRPAQRLQIPLVTVEETALGRMRRHREQAVVHGPLLVPGSPAAYATPRRGGRPPAGGRHGGLHPGREVGRRGDPDDEPSGAAQRHEQPAQHRAARGRDGRERRRRHRLHRHHRQRHPRVLGRRRHPRAARG